MIQPIQAHSFGNLIRGEWTESISGDDMKRIPLRRVSPVDQSSVLYEGHEATEIECQTAINSGVEAQKLWQRLTLEKRALILHAIAEKLNEKRDQLVSTISHEVGKPFWEAEQEIDACLSKISHTIESYNPFKEKSLISTEKKELIVRRKPIGLALVIAPFNFPCHLALGQIAPLLLAGNAVILKPSELTPLCGQLFSSCIHEAFPPQFKGVFQMLQGGKRVGETLVESSKIKGVFFTGSDTVGRAIQKASLQTPGRMVALEMGGNNPLVVESFHNVEDAINLTILSAYITSGQRCSAARRLIIVESEENLRFLELLQKKVSSLSYGPPHPGENQPFLGPLVSEQAKKSIIERIHTLKERGASILVGPDSRHSSMPSSCYINPLLVDCTGVSLEDKEDFGPLLKVIRVNSLQEAIFEANKTSFGLSASLLSISEKNFDLFFDEIQAGIINWNSPTTGASSRAPFGGIGLSGNYRPAGYSMIESCCYPVTTMKDKGRPPLDTLPPSVQIFKTT